MSVKLNPIMLVLGSLAAVVGGWGLYVMMTRIGGAPPFIGIITIAILELFAMLAQQGQTIVAATHDAGIHRVCTRTIAIADGRVWQ